MSLIIQHFRCTRNTGVVEISYERSYQQMTNITLMILDPQGIMMPVSINKKIRGKCCGSAKHFLNLKYSQAHLLLNLSSGYCESRNFKKAQKFHLAFHITDILVLDLANELTHF